MTQDAAAPPRPWWKNPWVLGFLGGIAVVTLSTPLFRRIPPPPQVIAPAPIHVLHDATGTELTRDELRGRIHVIALASGSCRSTCARVWRSMAELDAKWREVGVSIEVLLVDVDRPIKSELSARQAAIVGDDAASLLRIVTADDASTIALLEAAGMPGSTPHEAVHSPRLLLIDGDANVRGIYAVTESGLDETFHRAMAVIAESGRPSARSPMPATKAADMQLAPDGHEGLIHGRITTLDGATYEGRIRWGGDQEGSWGDYFNGSKSENTWLAQLPSGGLPVERTPIKVFGITIAHEEDRNDVDRQLMARFGDISRIEALGARVRVTLKSGTVTDVNRSDSSDFDDGVRVWDSRRGVVDLDSLRLRTIELCPTASRGAPSARLHGVVRTHQGEFTGFIGWDRDDHVGSDELDGVNAGADAAEVRVRFDTIGSISRRAGSGVVVTRHDGREIVLAESGDVGPSNRGIHVDDLRFGRVIVSWDAFERADFNAVGSAPVCDDFPPGSPLTGIVTTRAGRRLAGRLVHDLDESETTDTLDARDRGLHYTIPFGLIASIAPGVVGANVDQLAAVVLHGGEELQLGGTSDVGEGNAGILIFIDGAQRPEHVPWPDVARIDLNRPPAMYPPLARR